MRLKTPLVLALLGFSAALAAAQAPPPPPPPKQAEGAAAASWTGWITDTHCGKNGADKNHSAECVEKCMKGGSKAQVFNEADKKLYNLDSFDKAKSLVGQRVLVKGKLDAQTNTIAVESIAK